MYRGLTICLAIGWCGAAIVPIKDQTTSNEQTEQKEKSNRQTFETSLIGNQQQIYPLAQSNEATVSRYIYPMYPRYGNNRYAIQTGYEDYLVPAALSPQTTDSHWVTEIATSLLPLSGEILLYGARAGAYFLHFLFVILLGGAFTTMICTFTPICTINFLDFGPSKNQVKEQVAELAQTYLNNETVNAVTLLVSKALDRYAAMQDERQESTKQKEMENLANVSSTE